MAQLAKLPAPVTDLQVKQLLSISQLGFADQCLLRVAFGVSIEPPERLPAHPAATLGERPVNRILRRMRFYISG
jgi:hypothetical protein